MTTPAEHLDVLTELSSLDPGIFYQLGNKGIAALRYAIAALSQRSRDEEAMAKVLKPFVDEAEGMETEDGATVVLFMKPDAILAAKE